MIYNQQYKKNLLSRQRSWSQVPFKDLKLSAVLPFSLYLTNCYHLKLLQASIGMIEGRQKLLRGNQDRKDDDLIFLFSGVWDQECYHDYHNF